MPYNYHPTIRRNFKTGENLFYPAPAPFTPVDIDQVAAEISERCTVTRADIVGILKALETQLEHALLEGYTVRLGQIGSFRLTAKAVSVEEKDDVSAALVRNPRVRFAPSVWLRNKLRRDVIKFRRVK